MSIYKFIPKSNEMSNFKAPYANVIGFKTMNEYIVARANGDYFAQPRDSHHLITSDGIIPIDSEMVRRCMYCKCAEAENVYYDTCGCQPICKACQPLFWTQYGDLPSVYLQTKLCIIDLTIRCPACSQPKIGELKLFPEYHKTNSQWLYSCGKHQWLV